MARGKPLNSHCTVLTGLNMPVYVRRHIRRHRVSKPFIRSKPRQPTKVSGGGMTVIDGMGAKTIFGIVVDRSVKGNDHFICSINPPGPKMVIDAPIERTSFSDGKFTAWGVDKTWGKYKVTIGGNKLKLRWTRPFGPNKVIEITETNVLSTIRME